MIIYLRLVYHFWLPERGASGVMIGGNSIHQNNTIAGPFNSCNPSPEGELGLGSTHYVLSLH